MSLLSSLQSQIKTIKNNLQALSQQQIKLNKQNKILVKQLSMLKNSILSQESTINNLKQQQDQIKKRHERQISLIQDFFEKEKNKISDQYSKTNDIQLQKIANCQETLNKYKRLYEQLVKKSRMNKENSLLNLNTSNVSNASNTVNNNIMSNNSTKIMDNTQNSITNRSSKGSLSLNTNMNSSFEKYSQRKPNLKIKNNNNKMNSTKDPILCEMKCLNCLNNFKPYQYFQHIQQCNQNSNININDLNDQYIKNDKNCKPFISIQDSEEDQQYICQ